MTEQHEVSLTGSDSSVEGIVKPIIIDGDTAGYEFLSLDETLHLVIAKDEHGHWKRVSGSEPYLSGWTDELAEQVDKLN